MASPSQRTGGLGDDGAGGGFGPQGPIKLFITLHQLGLDSQLQPFVRRLHRGAQFLLCRWRVVSWPIKVKEKLVAVHVLSMGGRLFAPTCVLSPQTASSSSTCRIINMQRHSTYNSPDPKFICPLGSSSPSRRCIARQCSSNFLRFRFFTSRSVNSTHRAVDIIVSYPKLRPP